MKLVAVTRILDEADIVEAFVRHTASYVSHHILADNGSSDGTLDILGQLAREGICLTVIQKASVSFCETVSNTALLRLAAEQQGADCVIFLDTDEFIDDRRVEPGLRSALETAWRSDPAARVVEVPLTHYHPTSSDPKDELNVARRIRRHSGVADVHKVIVRAGRGSRNLTVMNGSHGVRLADGAISPALRITGLTYAHFPERSPAQYITKFVKGWAKVLAAGASEVGAGTNNHYRDPFHILRDEPERLLRSEHFLGFRNEHLATHLDPIGYRGGPLRYTPVLDEEMRAVRSLMGYFHALARQHGRLVDESREAARLVEEWNRHRETPA